MGRAIEMCAVRQCFVVATLVSMTPAEPFIFRNYEHPAASQRLAEQARANRRLRLMSSCTRIAMNHAVTSWRYQVCNTCCALPAPFKTHMIRVLCEAARSIGCGWRCAHA